MRKPTSPDRTQAPQRLLLSRGSFEVHVLQVQPICGTPTLVPVPKNLNFNPAYFPEKYFSISSSVLPFVSGRKNVAAMK